MSKSNETQSLRKMKLLEELSALNKQLIIAYVEHLNDEPHDLVEDDLAAELEVYYRDEIGDNLQAKMQVRFEARLMCRNIEQTTKPQAEPVAPLANLTPKSEVLRQTMDKMDALLNLLEVEDQDFSGIIGEHDAPDN